MCGVYMWVYVFCVQVARRLAKLAQAPFVKVEATRYTEVGVYGANTDSMISDLVAVSIKMETEKAKAAVQAAAWEMAEEEIMQALLRQKATRNTDDTRAALLAGTLKDRLEITLPKAGKGGGQTLGSMMDGPEQMRSGPPAPGQGKGPRGVSIAPGIEMFNLGSLFGGGQDSAPQTFTGTAVECLEKLREAHAEKLIDEKEITRLAIGRAEQSGIIFLDEIDKLASPAGRMGGLQHKTEGIQKELLGLVEGSCVNTNYGPVNTDHILFIASGAFHIAKPSDLLPELQGRLPIRVKLHKHSKEDLVKILTQKEFNLITQQRALIGTEGIDLEFTSEAVDEIASMAIKLNSQQEDIGARRLNTILSKVVNEVSFLAPTKSRASYLLGAVHKEVVDAAYVRHAVKDIVDANDLSKYVL
jgi:ATP-dependent HslUV protease ATP-binding subunit HslU